MLNFGSKSSPAACAMVHPGHIFTGGPCKVSIDLSLAASTHIWQHVLTCRMCILGIYCIHRWTMYVRWACTYHWQQVLTFGSMSSPAEFASLTFIHHVRWVCTYHWQQVLTFGSMSSPALHPRHIFTMYGGHVLITGSKYSPLAACPNLPNVHPWHIFTVGPCTVSMYCSLATSIYLQMGVLTSGTPSSAYTDSLTCLYSSR